MKSIFEVADVLGIDKNTLIEEDLDNNVINEIKNEKNKWYNLHNEMHQIIVSKIRIDSIRMPKTK